MWTKISGVYVCICDDAPNLSFSEFEDIVENVILSAKVVAENFNDWGFEWGNGRANEFEHISPQRM